MAEVVQSAERILYVIQFLNQENGVTANHMAAATQISRPATYRMLETLRSLGFVRKDEDGRYWLEPQILSLSSGYRDDRNLVERLTPILGEFSQMIPWPLSVSTPAGNAMLIRASTDLESSAAAHRRLAAGWPMPGLLNSAAGNVYLAFCDRMTRERLLDIIAEDKEDLLRQEDRAAIEEQLKIIAGRGYANVTHAVTWNWIDRTSALGVPIYVNDRLFGAMSMRYFRATLTEAKVIEQYLAPVQEAALRIGAALSL